MKLKLSEKWTAKLLKYPESGMGYQRVDVVLKSGKTIKGVVALNAEELHFPEEYTDTRLEEIVDIVVRSERHES
jgi:hypothetical protein